LTCPSDSIVVVIAIDYTDYHTYKSYVDSAEKVILQFLKNLALHGNTEFIYIYIYDTRVELHKIFFVKVEIYPEVKEINAECNIT